MVDTRSRLILRRSSSPSVHPSGDNVQPDRSRPAIVHRMKARNREGLIRPNASQTMGQNIKPEHSSEICSGAQAGPAEPRGSDTVLTTGGESDGENVAKDNVEIYRRSLSYVSIDTFRKEKGAGMKPDFRGAIHPPSADPDSNRSGVVSVPSLPEISSPAGVLVDIAKQAGIADNTRLASKTYGQRAPDTTTTSNINTRSSHAQPKSSAAEPGTENEVSFSTTSPNGTSVPSPERAANDQPATGSYEPVPIEERNLRAQDQVLRAHVALLRRIATNASTQESIRALQKISYNNSMQHHRLLSAWEELVRSRYGRLKKRLPPSEKTIFELELLRLNTDIVTQEVRQAALKATLTPEWLSDTGSLRRFVLAELARVEQNAAGMIQGNETVDN